LAWAEDHFYRSEEREMMVKELLDLEEMAVKLQDAARKLSPGPDRHALLQEIGRFRVQVSILRHTKSGAAAPATCHSEARRSGGSALQAPGHRS
jgi:hypothetical protein